jgi:predicted MFS family arabinose efflux permease
VAIAEAYGWRNAFFFAGIPGLITAVFIWKYVREPGRVAQVQGATAATADSGAGLNTLQLLGFRNIWLCTLICIAMVAWMVLGWTFLPLFYVNVRQFSTSDMAMLISVLGISAAVCGFLVPALSDRLGRKPVMVFFCLLSMLAPLAALYFPGSTGMLALLVFVGWSGAGCFPLFMAAIPSETIPARYLTATIGLVTGIGEAIGGVLSPTLAGMAADTYGGAAPIVIMVGCAAFAGIVAVFLKETAPLKVAAAARVAATA